MTTWRGLSVGDVYVIACFPDHPKTIDAIDVSPPRMAAPEIRSFFPKPTIEHATVWGTKNDRWQTRSETPLYVDAAGNPVWRSWDWDADGKWAYTEHAIVIVEHAPRMLVQLRMFGDAA